jgi:RNA polymerase sigma-70 factor (ECF subfamily)
MTQRYPAENRAEDERLPDPGEWVERYGDALYRYALARLRRPQEAEEAVQDTLLAALKGRGQFQGQSHPRTWLIGILKRKIADLFRRAARSGPGDDPEGDDLDR